MTDSNEVTQADDPYSLAALELRNEDDLHTIRNRAIMALEKRGIHTGDNHVAGESALREAGRRAYEASCGLTDHQHAPWAALDQSQKDDWQSIAHAALSQPPADDVALLREARGTISSLLSMLHDSTAMDDFIAQLDPGAKSKSGQPRDQFAKQARRTVNEAKAFIARLDARLASMGEG